MRKTVAVTGAAGFLGRSVVRALKEDPAVGRVIGIDRVSGDPDFEWSLVDIRDPGIDRVLGGADVVVHLAAVVLGDMWTAESVNVGGTRNLAEAAARAGVRRFVHASSVASYGFGVAGRLLTEEDRLNPLEAFPYSRTKGAAERALDEVEK
ncbi:MAG: NAD-dependent epimerase/dehydratase family protein, partial [Actinomycetota bacterium]